MSVDVTTLSFNEMAELADRLEGWVHPTFLPVSGGLPAIFDKAPAQSDSCSAETA